jgi:hypothetical protein
MRKRVGALIAAGIVLVAGAAPVAWSKPKEPYLGPPIVCDSWDVDGQTTVWVYNVPKGTQSVVVNGTSQVYTEEYPFGRPMQIPAKLKGDTYSGVGTWALVYPNPDEYPEYAVYEYMVYATSATLTDKSGAVTTMPAVPEWGYNCTNP